MGRVVCTLDADAAAARDAEMLARLESGAPALPPLASPPFVQGCILAEAPGAGSIFPQPCLGEGARRIRMDDVLGDGPWLIARDAAGIDAHGVDLVSLGSDVLAPFRKAIEAWLDAHGVEAVLVRPDRYVFGAGEPAALLAAWTTALTPLSRAA